eukprot:2400814-Pyramimonas_sp.AAC.2
MPPCPEFVRTSANLVDANRWAEHQLTCALSYLKSQAPDKDINTLRQGIDGLTLSSSFSGVGGGENTTHAIQKCMEHFTASDIDVRTLWALDWDTECRMELMCLPSPPAHIFSDQRDCIHPRIREELKAHGHLMYYEDIERIFRTPSSVVRCMQCALHAGCTCTTDVAELHIAGTECDAWSAQGSRCGATGSKVSRFANGVLRWERPDGPGVSRERPETGPLRRWVCSKPRPSQGVHGMPLRLSRPIRGASFETLCGARLTRPR